jgi:hypothetical protein
MSLPSLTPSAKAYGVGLSYGRQVMNVALIIEHYIKLLKELITCIQWLLKPVRELCI